MSTPQNPDPEEWIRNMLSNISPEDLPELLRQFTSAQEFLSRAMPEGDPAKNLGPLLMQFNELSEALKHGRWTEAHDRTLEEARQTVNATGTAGDQNSVMLRLMVAGVTADRLAYASQYPQSEDPPGAPRIRDAIQDLETAFAAFEKVPFPLPKEQFANGTQVRLAALNRLLATAPARPSPHRHRPTRPSRPAKAPSPTGPASPGDDGNPGMPSRDQLEALRRLTDMMPTGFEGRSPMRALVITMDVIHASTLEQSPDVQPMITELAQMAEDDTTSADEREFARVGLALAQGIQCQAKMASSRPADWPGEAELRERISQLEDVSAYVADVPGASSAMEQLLAGFRTRLAATGTEDTCDDRERQHSGSGQRVPPGERDTSVLLDAMRRAHQSRNSGLLTEAISEARAVSRELPAGHPARASILAGLAGLLLERGELTGARDDIPEAIDASITAIRSRSPGVLRESAYMLWQALGRMTTEGHDIGPFESAESALTGALPSAPDDDTRMLLHLCIGGARISHALTSGAPAPLHGALEPFTTAETLLGEPRPSMEWFGPLFQMMAWVLNGTMAGGADPDAFSLINRLSDRLEDFLVRYPELAEQMTGAFPVGSSPFPLTGDGPPVLQAIRSIKQMTSIFSGDGPMAQMFRADPQRMRAARSMATQAPFRPPAPQETRNLAARGLEVARHALRSDPPDAAILRTASNDLRAALNGGLDNDALRHDVDGVLGACLARLHWLGEPDHGVGPPGLATLLGGAIHHLERGLAGSEHRFPDAERAELTDLLARCYRRSSDLEERRDGARQAELTAYAALREFARCVLISGSADDGLSLAERANEIVKRTASWCLTDGRPDAAVAVAEAGRGLVLASSVIAGRVTEVLEGAGEHDAARAWEQGGQQQRRTALDALWKTRFGGSLLRTPAPDEIGAAIQLAGSADAIVYLVPPGVSVPGSDWPLGSSGIPGRALVCRAGVSGQVEELPMPEMNIGDGSPLAAYHVAFASALASAGSASWDPGDHENSDQGVGQAWLRTLDELGAWAYDHVTGPLAAHVSGWGSGRVPRLILVPLGELASVPFAAAWTPDGSLPGGRRYSVHDLVLSYAVTGRLLTEVGRRRQRRLSDRVVLASTGDFPYARATSRALARQLYPNAEVYGRGLSPNGLATTDRLLSALPGSGRHGASLLHLTTHGTSEPVAQLQTADGWLEVGTILRAARDRRSSDPGGIVITNACLTDSTRSHYDESVTLATALLAAGATGVIGTRWPVYEDTSAALSYCLHQHLAAGHEPAAALRLAQLDLIAADPPGLSGQPQALTGLSRERRAHPASWAGYTYHGL